jgi:hypothetical protein
MKNLKKKFLLIGPIRFRSTDGVIIQGIKNLLSSIYDNQTIFKYQILDDNNIMSEEDIFADENFDGIFVCGTPWLWDSFQKSTKYQNTQKIFSYHKETPKVFFGIGSCISLELIWKKEYNIFSRKEEVNGIVNLFSNSTVITRDSLAHKFITNSGVKSHLLPCPSYFSYGLNPESSSMEQNVLIWCDPAKTISSIDWEDKKRLEIYYEICLTYNKKYDPTVYCSEEADIPKAIKLGLKPKKTENYIETLEIMKTANHVLSGRVHYGVPAFIQGCKLGILPIDSRHFVLSEWGCTVVDNIPMIDSLSSCKLDIQKYYKEYYSIITKAIPLE